LALPITAKIVKFIKNDRGITYRDFDFLGYGKNTINNWAMGHSVPDWPKFMEFLNAMGENNVYELLEEIDKAQSNEANTG